MRIEGHEVAEGLHVQDEGGLTAGLIHTDRGGWRVGCAVDTRHRSVAARQDRAAAWQAGQNASLVVIRSDQPPPIAVIMCRKFCVALYQVTFHGFGQRAL